MTPIAAQLPSVSRFRFSAGSCQVLGFVNDSCDRTRPAAAARCNYSSFKETLKPLMAGVEQEYTSLDNSTLHHSPPSPLEDFQFTVNERISTHGKT